MRAEYIRQLIVVFTGINVKCCSINFSEKVFKIHPKIILLVLLIAPKIRGNEIDRSVVSVIVKVFGTAEKLYAEARVITQRNFAHQSIRKCEYPNGY